MRPHRLMMRVLSSLTREEYKLTDKAVLSGLEHFRTKRHAQRLCVGSRAIMALVSIYLIVGYFWQLFDDCLARSMKL